MFYNYKGLPYKKSLEQFKEDYNLSYQLYGKDEEWITKRKERIKIKDLHKLHIANIVNFFGCAKIRAEYPFIFYRYIKEVLHE